MTQRPTQSSERHQRGYCRIHLCNTQEAAWSATPDDKSQTKYPEYPWEVKDQIKEKRNSADESAS
jgi:hypothetical protein